MAREMVRRMLLVSSVLVALVAGSGAGYAQGRPGAAGGKRAAVVEKIREVRKQRIAQVLGLDDATAKKLWVVMDRYDDQILPLRAEIGQARRALKQSLESGTYDEKQGAELIDRMTAARKKIVELEDQRQAEARKVLTPRQFAMLVVALPEIDRALEKEIRKAIQRRGGGGAGGLDPGDDE